MAIEDVSLPKTYKNKKTLFEENLDDWRKKEEQVWADYKLNLTQLIKDLFSVGYDFDNDGLANKAVSLEDRLNQFAGGSFPIPGTTSNSFAINTDGFSATLSTSLLTANRTFTFPDISGTFAVLSANQTFTGTNIFNNTSTFAGIATLTTPALTGAGAGKVTLQYANSANNRTVTFDDPSGNDSVAYLSAAQTLASKTLTTPTIADFTNATHTHANAAGGGQLDWDNVWSDAAHDHSSAGEGGNIPEASITDGTILARVGSNETITGSWTFPATDPPNANQITRRGPSQANGGGSSAGNAFGDYNISSYSKTATGIYQGAYDTDFSSINHIILAQIYTGPGSASAAPTAAGTFIVIVVDMAGTHIDNAHYFAAFGDQ